MKTKLRTLILLATLSITATIVSQAVVPPNGGITFPGSLLVGGTYGNPTGPVAVVCWQGRRVVIPAHLVPAARQLGAKLPPC